MPEISIVTESPGREAPDAFRRAGEHEIARLERHDLADPRDLRTHVEDEVARSRGLPDHAIDQTLHLDVVRIDLVDDDPRADRAEARIGLAPDHVQVVPALELDVARGHVIRAGVAPDRGKRLLPADAEDPPAHHARQLRLVLDCDRSATGRESGRPGPASADTGFMNIAGRPGSAARSRARGSRSSSRDRRSWTASREAAASRRQADACVAPRDARRARCPPARGTKSPLTRPQCTLASNRYRTYLMPASSRHPPLSKLVSTW